jgi:hypothetical protein
MKKIALAALVAIAPLSAQSWELGVFAGQQSFKDFSALGETVKVDSKTVLAARVGYSVVDLGPALFQLTAGFQPEVTTTATVAGMSGSEDIKHSYMSVGAMFNFKAFVAVGAGVEYRSEKIKGGSTDTTYGRPWARANIGVAFPTPLVKPFVGLEVSAPLTSKSNEYGSSEDILKSMAPKLQIGIYGGIRF